MLDGARLSAVSFLPFPERSTNTCGRGKRTNHHATVRVPRGAS